MFQKLETIIEKSFFPDLEKLKVQKAYQDALKANNINALRELYSKYQNLLTPSSSTSRTASKPQIILKFFLTHSKYSFNKKKLFIRKVYGHAKFDREQKDNRR